MLLKLNKNENMLQIAYICIFRSVREVLEREYQEKIAFVERNTLFSHWPAKQKKALVISLQRENLKYSTPITKQGHSAENMFFILR